MARDEVDPSLILTERRKRKVSSYITNEDNGSLDKADTVKRLRRTIESTENQSYSDEQNEDTNQEDDLDSPHPDDAGSDSPRNEKKNHSKKKKMTTSRAGVHLGPNQLSKTLSSRDGRTLQKQPSRALLSHDSDADSEEDEIEMIEVIEKPEEEPGEELGESS